MRSQLLGAYINGIHNFLVITGDPIPSMVRTTVKSVFNFDSVGLMQILADMNEEQFAQAPVSYGGAINQGRRNLDGYRLWNDVHGDVNRTSDLFDASQILDPRRTDVPAL